MATAASLEQAAQQAYVNLFARFVSNTLKTRLTAFAANLATTFLEQDKNSHPVSNWLALIAGLADVMPPGANTVTYDQFNTSVQYVYRICWIGQQLVNQTLITTAQQVALLAQYNAQF